MADFTNPYISLGSKWGGNSYGAGSSYFDEWFNGGKFGKKFNPNPERFLTGEENVDIPEDEEHNTIFGSSFLRFGKGALRLEGFMENENIGGSIPIVLDVKSPLLKDDMIKLLQSSLNYLYDDFKNVSDVGGPLAVDGSFGTSTKKAFKYFQDDKGVTTKNDGVVDQETVRKLDIELLKKQGIDFGNLVSQAMIDLRANVTFIGDPSEVDLNHDFWQVDKKAGFSVLMKSEVKEPALAVMAIFKKSGNKLDCQLGTQAVYWKAILDFIGEKKFNKAFKFRSNGDPGVAISISVDITNRLASFKYRIPKLINSVDDFVPGDWPVYDNCYEYRFKHPGGGWNHENLIYEGNQRFNGFGTVASNFKEDVLKDEMIDAYKAARSPYDYEVIKYRLNQEINENGVTRPPTQQEKEELQKRFDEFKDDKTIREPRGFDWDNTIRFSMKRIVALKS